MGCVGSKIRNGVAVSHSRQRKRFVKGAINARKHFVIDHANYLVALKAVGVAFREFALVEFREQQSTPNPSNMSATEIDKSSSSAAATKMPAFANHSRMRYQNTPLPSKTLIVTPLTSKIAYWPERPWNSVRAKEESVSKMRRLASMAYVNTPSVSEVVVISPMRLMAYRNEAFVSDTVTVSPPQSPDDQRIWNRHSSYQGYINDSPYQEVDNDAMPSSSSSQEPDPSSSIFTAGWDWLDLFSAPRMTTHFQGSPSIIRDETLKQVPEEEMPALEVEETLPRDVKMEQKDGEIEEVEQKNGEVEKVKDVEQNNGEIEEVKTNDTKVSEMGISKVAENEKHSKEDSQGDHEGGGGTSLKPLNLEPEEELTTEKHLNNSVAKDFQKSRNLLEVLTEIDELFLKASESGKNTFKVLEASKLHYHADYTDLQGFSDHSSRFLSFVSRSYLPYRTPFSSTSTSTTTSTSASTPTASSTPTSTAASEDLTAEDPSLLEGHASTLDQIYAWESKLCKEVKERESINVQLERKRRKVQTLHARREEDDKIDRVRASLKVLETERVVADQAMDVTVSTIRNLTDDQLHPQLLQLLEELTIMWREMCACHEHQRDVVFNMHFPEDQALEATSNSHRRVTQQLESALNNLLKGFSAVMTSQKEYIQNLSKWLSSSLYGLERGSSQTSASIPTKAAPQIYYLCRRWKQALDKLPYNMVIVAIKKFVKIAREIINLQSNELRIKKRLDYSTKDLAKKIQALHNAQLKHSSLIKVREENSATDDQVLVTGRVEERTEEVENLRKKVEVEREIYLKAMQATRTGTLSTFKIGLPELFQTFSEFATQCSKAYAALYSWEKNGKFESD